MIEILPADNKKNFNKFLDLPFKLYPKNSSWCPPLKMDVREQFSSKNPFFKHAEVKSFIAKINGQTVGRIAAIYNEAHINFHQEKAGFFGFFDCVDENLAAQALMDKAKQWLTGKGMSIIRGPMNFSSNEELGLLVEGFEEPPMVMMPYNFPYYKKLFERCGLRKAKDLFAYIIDVPKKLPEKAYRVSGIAEKQGITARPFNMKAFKSEMNLFKGIYNSAWEKNWGFVPMTDEEIDHTAKKLKQIMIPELTLIAECKGEAVGFMMMLPDFNFVLKKINGRLFPLGLPKALWYSRKIKDLRLLLLGIKPGYRRRGVDSLLFIEGLKTMLAKGFKRVEFSWILEDNYPVQRVIETFNGRLYKKYRIYEKEI
ncbi:MAG: N-acetyltransferase [Nitrospirae bacterium]|nr:N-acetyltransferase [Nitrospirota bacterium]